MTIEEYADRLYTQAITDPSIDPLNQHELARYIREEASHLCLNWRAVLKECGDLEPYTTDFKKASELVGNEKLKAHPVLY